MRRVLLLACAAAALMGAGFVLGFAQRHCWNPPAEPQFYPAVVAQEEQEAPVAVQATTKPQWADLPTEGEYELYLHRIIDGDTVEVAYLVGPRSLRINGINAPELRDKGGIEARMELARLAAGGLRPMHFKLSGVDKYGRLLGDFRAFDAEEEGWASERMIANGHAKPYGGKGPKP